ncbi:MAG: extracellular solute-binding protein, partial [Omnitrophica WOR_2 bacterium]
FVNNLGDRPVDHYHYDEQGHLISTHYKRYWWTLDDMFKAAKDLTVKNGNTVSRFGIYNPPDDPFMTSLCGVSNGGQSFMNSIIQPTKLTVDKPYIDCARKWADAVKAGYVTPPGYPTDGLSDQFLAGQIPMFWFGQWMAPTFLTAKPGFKYGFAPMPVGAKDVQPYDAVGICAPATIQNPDAVWKVMKFLASDAWKTVLPKAPVAPAAHLPSSQPYFDTLKADGLSSVADSVQYELNAKDKQGIRFTASWSAKANDILTANWNDILQGKKALDSTITSMVNDLTSVIQSTK